jgi:hypothetical protein
MAIKTFKGFPLRVVLVAAFVTQTVLISGVIAIGSWWRERQAITQLSEQLRADSTRSVTRFLENYLRGPYLVNSINVKMWESGILDFKEENFEKIGRFFWQQMQVYDVSFINFGAPDMSYIGVERFDDGTFQVWEVSPQRYKSFDNYFYILDDKGNRTSKKTVKPMNPLLFFDSEAWYKDAVDSR